MGNTLLPNNPTLDEMKDLIRRINSRIKIVNASVNQEELTIDSPIATIIQSNSTDPGEYTTTDIDPTNFYTKNEINTLLQGKVNSADLNTLLNTLDDSKVSKSGDTMTGNLVIEGPVNNVGLGINVSGESGRGVIFRFAKVEDTERIYVYQFKNNNTNYDLFRFPFTDPRETTNGNYDLLSTKNVVTTEQGGTGANDAANARKNLGYLGMFFAQNVNTDECVEIPTNADLNTAAYTATGKYVCKTNAIAGTLTNKPNTARAFQMLVYNLLGETTDQLPSGIWDSRTRIAMDYSGRIFISYVERASNGNYTWGAWKEIQQV